MTIDVIIATISQKIAEYEITFGVRPTRIHLGKSEMDILVTWANQQKYETGYLDSNNGPQLFGIKLSELYLTPYIGVS
jgi:hypothetical protein